MIQRVDIEGNLTSLGIALGALTAFFGSVEFDNDSSPTKVICKDDSDNVIFEVSKSSDQWTYTVHKDENTTVATPASNTAVAAPQYLYTVGNTGAVIEAPNGFLIAIAKVTTGETGFVLPSAFGTAANRADVNVGCWGDDPLLSTRLLFAGNSTGDGQAMIGNQCLFTPVSIANFAERLKQAMIGNQCLFTPVPLHGTYRRPMHLVDTFFMPMAQAGMRGTVQQITDGTSTYLTNGYLAMLDTSE